MFLYSLYLKTTAKVRVDEDNLKGGPDSEVVPKTHLGPTWLPKWRGLTQGCFLDSCGHTV